MKFARVKIVLFARVLKDGTSPVCLRVTYRRKSRYFTLNKQCLPEQFDKKAGRFTKDFPDHRRANDLLRTWESRAADALYQFERDGVTFTFNRFERAVFGEPEKDGATLWQYIEEIGGEFEASGSLGNSEKYSSLAAVVKAFAQRAILEDMNYSWLERFEKYLRRERKNSDGGAAFTLRTLRAVCNRAIKSGRMSESWYPFKNYKIQAAQVKGGARALTKEQIKILESADGLDEKQRFALDLFLLSYYLRGANMADIARLTHQNIVGGRMVYARQKTGKVYSIPINEKAQAILDRYTGSVYLVPVLVPGLNEKKERNRIHVATRNANAGIREVAALVGIEADNLSFYSARHTAATVLKFDGVPVEVVSEWLGHSDIKTTKAYLKKFEQSVLDEADKALD